MSQQFPIPPSIQAFEELNVFLLIRALVRYRVVFVVVFFLGMGSVVAFNYWATPLYQAKASFFIPPDEKNDEVGKAFQLQLILPQNYFSMVLAILNSNQAKKEVATFVHTKQPSYSIQKLDRIFEKTPLFFNRDMTGLITIRYESSDPKLAFWVVSAYLKVIGDVSRTLDFVPLKRTLIILDYPEMPKQPSKPMKKMNLVLGIPASFFLAVMVVVLVSFVDRMRLGLKEDAALSKEFV